LRYCIICKRLAVRSESEHVQTERGQGPK
jgi:hypothetical protein